MSRVLTIISTFLLASSLAGAVLALPTSPAERAQSFANCAGRYAALSMHQSFFDGAATEAADRRYKVFLDLLEAIREDALNYGVPGPQILHWRVEARAAHATLLHRATFHSDPYVSSTSQRAATGYMARCDTLLLGS